MNHDFLAPHRRIGEFVDLRPLVPSDAAITFAWRSGDRAMNLNQGARSVEAQAAWIASRPGNEHNFMIELKDGCPVGMVSLVDIDLHHRRAEPGRFLIGDERRARGVPAAVEAMKLVYDLAFDDLGLVRIHGLIASDNTAILKWQTFLGLQIEGRLRNHYFINGHFQDAISMGLLVGEYQAVTRPKMLNLLAMCRRGPSDQPRRPAATDRGVAHV